MYTAPVVRLSKELAAVAKKGSNLAKEAARQRQNKIRWRKPPRRPILVRRDQGPELEERPKGKESVDPILDFGPLPAQVSPATDSTPSRGHEGDEALINRPRVAGQSPRFTLGKCTMPAVKTSEGRAGAVQP